MRTSRRSGLLAGVLAVGMLCAGCVGSGDEPIPLEQARAEVDSLVHDLQTAFALDEELMWVAPDSTGLGPDEDGICRWRAGSWTAQFALGASDPSWDERREAVNDVLAEHDLEPVGEPGYTGGGAAYGFTTEGPAGGKLRIATWKGETAIAVYDLAVQVDGDCDDAAVSG